MKLKIKIYSELDNLVESEEYFAIKTDNVIKYIDLANNKMNIDLENNLIIRENSDFIFNIDFINNNINIFMKKIKKYFNKKINTLKLIKTNNSFEVKYKLIDENIINNFYIKY